MKLKLPSVTLLACDCLNTDKIIKVIEHCKSMCDFGDVKFLTSIPTSYNHAVEIMPLNSLIAYSIFMLTRVHQYINTDHLLVVQRDGWILNPQSWNEEWLQNDYTAPLFMQYDHVGSGGFSLRSNRLMKHMADVTPEWDGTQKGAEAIQRGLSYYEDGQISFTIPRTKFNFSTLEEGATFAQGGNRNPIYFREQPFGFHRTFQNIDFQTGIVDSSDSSADIHVSYDAQIDKL